MRRIHLVVALLLAASACGGDADGQIPARSDAVTIETTTSSTLAAQDIVFTTADGLSLEGRRVGTGDLWVVLAHMRPADMGSWASFADEVAAAGATALTFNFRGYGDSDGSGFDVETDVLAAIDYAISQGAAGVSLVGASMGGTGAVAAAATRPVLRVATLSAPAAFEGSDALAAAPRVAVPLLAVAAESDSPYADHARMLVDAVGADHGELLILSGAAHGTNLFGTHSDLAERLLDFLGL